jgi:hypothetical protein
MLVKYVDILAFFRHNISIWVDNGDRSSSPDRAMSIPSIDLRSILSTMTTSQILRGSENL